MTYKPVRPHMLIYVLSLFSVVKGRCAKSEFHCTVKCLFSAHMTIKLSVKLYEGAGKQKKNPTNMFYFRNDNSD